MKKLISLSDEQKEIITKITGLVVAIFGIFTFLAVVSYLLHWRADMSGEVLRNAAGSLGYGYARFLICRCFGLGSFAILAVFAALSVRLLKDGSQISVMSYLLKSLLGAFVFSLLFAYIGGFVGEEFAFGGGLGGDCGRFVCAWTTGKVGQIVTGLIIVILLIVFFVFVSNGFAQWVSNIGKSKPKAVESAEPEEVPEEECMEESIVEEAPEEPTPDPIPEETTSESLPTESEYPEVQVQEGEKLDTEVSKPLPRIDNRLDIQWGGLPNFKFFPLDLLDTYEKGQFKISTDELERNKNKICMTLRDYKIEVEGVTAAVGPTVTLYKITLGKGSKIAQVKNLQEDIGMSLCAARGVRVVSLPDSVGIEVANDRKSIVPLRGLLNSEE